MNTMIERTVNILIAKELGTFSGESSETGTLPRYTQDHNECAKMIESLKDGKWEYFDCALVEICSHGEFDMKKQPIATMHYVDALKAIHATPFQKCMAFIKTKGLNQ